MKAHASHEHEVIRGKYTRNACANYKVKRPSKQKAELKLIDAAFESIPMRHKVLDAPCGTGRVLVHLAQKHYFMMGADYADGMIDLAREFVTVAKVPCTVEKQDIMNLTYADKSFDSVLCFRLFHHFKDIQLKKKLIQQICRVAREYVLLSYFHPISVTSAKRRLKRSLGLRTDGKQATSLRELKSHFMAEGFSLDKDFARLRYVNTLHIARFKRDR